MPSPTTVRTVGTAALGVTAALFALTAGFEGKRNNSYLDPVHIPTVCMGHTDPSVRLGQHKTDVECNAILVADLQKAQHAVDRHVRVQVSSGERDAYTDFTFNVGEAAFSGSTLLRKLNAGDHAGACEELPKWNKARQGSRVVVLPGLTTRRQAERKLCLSGVKHP